MFRKESTANSLSRLFKKKKKTNIFVLQESNLQLSSLWLVETRAVIKPLANKYSYFLKFNENDSDLTGKNNISTTRGIESLDRVLLKIQNIFNSNTMDALKRGLGKWKLLKHFY